MRGCSLCYQFWLSGTYRSSDAGSSMLAMHEECRKSSAGFINVRHDCQFGPRLLLRFLVPWSKHDDLVLRNPNHYLHPKAKKPTPLACSYLSVQLLPTSISSMLLLYLMSGFRLMCLSHAEPPADWKVKLAGSTRGSLSQAKIWLEHCELLHGDCHKPSATFLPARLISKGRGAVRLCRGTNLPRSTRYATLSHCWDQTTFAN
jgi:hypothetical protein